MTPVPLELHTIPPEDPAVYDMICRADTIGVFQIESRAQMSMLPRLRPRCFYDLVIQVAIVRPGPIQGNMVHPYLRRRSGQEEVTYPKDDDKVKKVLAKTLGIPLFQEQAMSLAIVAAGFTPGEADQLRRAMAAWKSRPGAILGFGEKFIGGMLARGYDTEFAHRCFEQLKGFSSYGFPESHAASFARLVYISAWLKRHHPAAFAAALINSQPMGFYAPAQIVRDAREHGVEVREVDVNFSEWDCTLEEGAQVPRCQGVKGGGDPAPSTPRHLDTSTPSSLALRLGTRLVSGLSEADARAIAAAVRDRGPFRTIESLWRASGVKVASLRALARADAFRSMGLDRQHALWQIRNLRDEPLPIFDAHEQAAAADSGGAPLRASSVPLPPIPPDRQVVHDYAAIGLSLKAHPLSFVRDQLAQMRVAPNASLRDQAACPDGSPISVAGIVLSRQRPSTASGILFATIEDETGVANLIIRPHIYDRFRKAARHAVVLIARGYVERQGEVVHVMVRSLQDGGDLLEGLEAPSRDFH